LVQFVKMGVEHGIAAGECDLSKDIMLPAEVIEIIKYPEGTVEFKGLAIAAVITVATVQVTGLGDVPLQGKGRGCKAVWIGEDSAGKVFAADNL